MPSATIVEAGIGGWPTGDATLYRLDPPLEGHAHVVVYVSPAQPHLPARAVAIPATERGAAAVPSMKPVVAYSHPAGPNHAGALWLAGGYDIVAAPESPADPAGPNTE